MRLKLATVGALMFAMSALQHAQSTSARTEPSYSFALIDKKLTLLSQEQLALTNGEARSRRLPARSMERTVASIVQTAARLQFLYARRRQPFGARMFRLLRSRAEAVHKAVNSLAVADNSRTRQTELRAVNSRILALVTQFQAVSVGYSALRCAPREWTCCSPKRRQDLRPGESMACRWMCVSKARSCTGFRGPRLTIK
jgi:hypothetical protein